MIALAQVVLLNLSQGHIHVVSARQVAGSAYKRVVIEDIQHTRNRCEHIVFTQARFIIFAATRLLLGTFCLTIALGATLGAFCTITILVAATRLLLGTFCLTIALGATLGAFCTITILVAATLTGAGTLRGFLAISCRAEGHIQGCVEAVQACGAVGSRSLQIRGVGGDLGLLGTLHNMLRSQLGTHI